MSGGRDPLGEDVRREAADWFARLRGDASDADRDAFADWRRADPANAEAYERMLQHWDRTAFLANTGLAKARDLGRVTRRPAPKRYLVAACAALVAVGGVSLIALQTSEKLSAQTLDLRIATGAGERRTVSLDDETRITLEAASLLELSFNERARRAKLSRGGVRFEIPRPDPRPLVVEADTTRVLATQAIFEVSLVAQGTRVRAVSGEVEIGGSGPAEEVRRLREGEDVLRPASEGARAPQIGAAQSSPAMVAFMNEPVKEAIARFNQASTRQIVVADPEIARRRVSGAFRTDDPAGFAAALVAMFGGKVSDTATGPLRIERAR